MPTLKLQGYFTECGYNSPLTVGSHLPAKPRHSIGCKSEPGNTPLVLRRPRVPAVSRSGTGRAVVALSAARNGVPTSSSESWGCAGNPDPGLSG